MADLAERTEYWGNTIDSDDAEDGSEGGYDAHGNSIPSGAMMELLELRAALRWEQPEEDRVHRLAREHWQLFVEEELEELWDGVDLTNIPDDFDMTRSAYLNILDEWLRAPQECEGCVHPPHVYGSCPEPECMCLIGPAPARALQGEQGERLTAWAESVAAREKALIIADGYKEAPCFADLLGELDEDNPCSCPTCALRAIILVLAPTEPHATGGDEDALREAVAQLAKGGDEK